MHPSDQFKSDPNKEPDYNQGLKVPLAGLLSAMVLMGIFLLIMMSLSHLAHQYFPSWAAAPQF
jgi:hypothetical protein